VKISLPHEERQRRVVVVSVLVAMAIASFAQSLVEITSVDLEVLGSLYDGREYISLASNLLTGHGYLITEGTTFISDDPTAYRTPGYPWLLVLVAKVAGLDHLVSATILFQAVILAAVPALFFLLSRRLGLGVGAALGAAGFAFLFLPLRYLSMLIQPELIAVVLLLLAVERLLAHLETGSMASAVGSATCLAGAILFKQNLIVVLILFAYPLSRWLKRSAWVVMATIVVVVISPWMVRNAVIVGAPVVSTNGGINFYLGNNPQVPVNLDRLADHGQVVRTLMEEGRSELEADRELYRRGWRLFTSQSVWQRLQRLVAKVGVMARDYFPITHNEVFFMLLPIVLAWGRAAPLTLLLVAQLVVGFVVHPVEISPRGFYYANLVDILVLKVYGVLALYYFSREGRRGFQLLLLLYILVLLPGVFFIPVDRITYMADSLLIPAFAASPVMLRSIGRRFVAWRRWQGEASI
jgi:hypothetical protein